MLTFREYIKQDVAEIVDDVHKGIESLHALCRHYHPNQKGLNMSNLSTDAQSVISTVNSVASSSVGQAVITELKAFVGQAAGVLVEGYITLAKIQNPDADQAAITSIVEGDVKHYMRGKLSFFVDVLYSIEGTAINADVASLVAASYA